MVEMVKWGRPKGSKGKPLNEATKEKIRQGVKAAYAAYLRALALEKGKEAG